MISGNLINSLKSPSHNLVLIKPDANFKANFWGKLKSNFRDFNLIHEIKCCVIVFVLVKFPPQLMLKDIPSLADLPYLSRHCA